MIGTGEHLCWLPAALAAVMAMLACTCWRVDLGVDLIPAENVWEPSTMIYSLEDLRERLFGVVLDTWSLLVPWTPDGPAEVPMAGAIVEEALSACHDRLVAMGWRTPVEASSR